MVTGGAPSPVLSEDEVHARRKLAVRWLEWACCHGEIAKADPRYTAVTEGRDRRPADQLVYSSCADLAHWMYWQIGVRSPWINRAKHLGWRAGVNVNRLYPRPVGVNPCAARWDGQEIDGGDVLIVGTARGERLHVVCVVHERDGMLCTAQYGVFGLRVGGIGGRLVTRLWDRVRFGARNVLVVLPLERVLVDAYQRGLLLDPEQI